MVHPGRCVCVIAHCQRTAMVCILVVSVCGCLKLNVSIRDCVSTSEYSVIIRTNRNQGLYDKTIRFLMAVIIRFAFLGITKGIEIYNKDVKGLP